MGIYRLSGCAEELMSIASPALVGPAGRDTVCALTDLLGSPVCRRGRRLRASARSPGGYRVRRSPGDTVLFQLLAELFDG